MAGCEMNWQMILFSLSASSVPFAAVLLLVWLSTTRTGQPSANILSLFALLFLLLGIAVHSVAPLFLFDVYFHKKENRRKRFLLCIAPAGTIVIWVCLRNAT